MQEVDKEELRELLASQSYSQEIAVATGIKMVKFKKRLLLLSFLIICLFSFLQWTKIQKTFSSRLGLTHF